MNQHEFEDLNYLLKGELSAVAAYESAMNTVKDPVINKVLEQNRVSHTNRTDKLRAVIRKMSVVPDEDGGVWPPTPEPKEI